MRSTCEASKIIFALDFQPIIPQLTISISAKPPLNMPSLLSFLLFSLTFPFMFFDDNTVHILTITLCVFLLLQIASLSATATSNTSGSAGSQDPSVKFCHGPELS